VTDWGIYRVGQRHTNWDQYRLEDIWAMVSGEIDKRNWDQIRSWRIMATLCQHHADRLRTAAEALAQRWSPGTSPAAAEFTGLVGKTIQSMTEASTCAEANANAIERIMSALLDAHVKIKELLDQRLEVTAELTSYIGTPAWDADYYHEAARKVMMLTDVAIAEAHADLRKPPDPVNFRGAPPSPVGQPNLGPAGGEVPPLPIATPPVAIGTPALPGHSLPQSSHASSDPVLSGLPASFRATGGWTTADISAAGGLGDVGLGDVGPGDLVAGAPMVGPGGVIGAAVGRGPAGTGSTTATRGPAAVARATTSGGAAATSGGRGAGPGAGVPFVPVAPPVGRHGGVRTNPVGGMIGTHGHAVTIGRGRRHSDPDDPWAVQDAGPGVLLPPPEPEHHDPGPGVIGIDR
jgi:hypothetical protein